MSETTDKKYEEFKTLSLVYRVDEFEIECSEKPDFRLRYRDQPYYFGVEVTDFYYSMSNARLQNIHGYIEDILYQDRFRHKDDKKLRVEEVHFVSSDGRPKGSHRMIFQTFPSIGQYVSKLVDTIESKSTKLADYNQDLKHINLIVVEKDVFGPKTAQEFYRYFFTETLREALYNSNFREVFFVSTLRENHRQVYFPLKMALLFSGFYLFCEIFDSYPWDVADDESQISVMDESDRNPYLLLLKLYAKYLRSKTSEIYFREETGQGEVILGGAGLRYEDGIVVIFYDDYSYPLNAQPVEEDQFTDLFRSEEFRKHEREILKGAPFVMAMAFNVNTDEVPG